MIKSNTTKHIADLKFFNSHITIEYTFIEAELDYFNGTGTYEHTTINKVYKDNIDITDLLHDDYIEDLENQTLEIHLNK
tara:strand:+ start:767 stop:1003 length:237 start_codon:yes stop_codon:yes gene_type:complete